MKKIMVVMLALGLAMGASAQRFGHGFGGGRVYVAPPRVSVGIGYGYSPFYSPFGYYPYSPYGYNTYGRTYRPSKMEMKIEDIKNDYKDKIWSAKHDTSLTRRERRQEVRRLKDERNAAIDDLKRNYHRS